MIYELSGHAVRYIYKEEDFTFFVLGEPISAKEKGHMLKKMEVRNNLSYNGRFFRTGREGVDKLFIKKGSEVTFVKGRSAISAFGDKQSAKEMLTRHMKLPFSSFLSCKPEINKTTVTFKHELKSGYDKVITDIGSLYFEKPNGLEGSDDQ